jgi:hypothetical protein
MAKMVFNCYIDDKNHFLVISLIIDELSCFSPNYNWKFIVLGNYSDVDDFYY